MRWRTAAVTATAALLVTASATNASAAPPPSIPPPAPGALAVAAFLTGRITLVKADAPVDMPVQTLRVYAYESSVRHGGTTISASRAWIVRRPNANPVYGVFAPVTATGHAGGHTLTATVSQQQVVDAASSTYLPLVLSSRSASGIAPTTTVRGSTVLHVDALQVDGAPVDVGVGCASAQTVGIALTSVSGWTDLHGGLLRGVFTVPAFTGCDTTVGGTSALLTTAFSAQANTVTLARGEAGTWDTTKPRDCDRCGRPPAIP
jgi:hypothetical protein